MSIPGSTRLDLPDRGQPAPREYPLETDRRDGRRARSGRATTHDVLQVVATNDRRGAEVFALDLAGALTDRGRSIRTVALAPGRHDGHLDVPVLGSRRLGLGTLHTLREEISRARFVIAHGSTTLPACALASANTGVPFLYRNIGDPVHWGASRSRRTRSTLLLRRPIAVVALSEATARQLAFRYRVNPDRIYVIPKGVSAERFPVSTSDAARRMARVSFGLDDEVVVALCVGALSPEKNVALSIAAIAALPAVHLLIVGDGPERKALESEATKRAPGRVHFAGAIDDTARAYAAADAVVLSSWSEGLPGALIEAGLSGLPAVATNVGFVNQIVVDEETGFLVPAGDCTAMSAALDQAIRHRDRLGNAARAHCLDNFELGAVAKKWDALLAETLGPARTAPAALV